ncbi:MAG TPA: iron chelate uptake ABC transporter family permease subunit [Bacteroidia bacterium]|nr:iron chelate uptake ABC transporter family permease subunit [Bacteroidia bacterium]HNT80447.1 iron chelate uptake ABC transporter family permease subunit [Bacteroidia bacterium]
MNIVDFLLLREPNIWFVVLGSVLLGASSALVGTYAFLKKQSLVGDAIAHAVLPGICLGYLISGSKSTIHLLVAAVVSGWLAVYLINYIPNKSKLKSDTSIAIVLSVFFGLGIMLLTFIQKTGNSSQAGLDKFLFGKAAALTPSDALVFISISLFLLLAVVVLFKELNLICFNRDYALSIGLPVKRLEFVLSVMIILSVSSGIQAVGVVLMSALLIAPAAAARFWSSKISSILMLGALFGVIAAWVGAFVSHSISSMPTGPWIVVVLTCIALFSFVFAPHKGLIARRLKHRDNQFKILKENLLKSMYHLTGGDRSKAISKSMVLNQRDFSETEFTKGFKRLLDSEEVLGSASCFYLTKLGIESGKRVVRLHRLWELYLSKRLNLQDDHLHADAESMEHIITPDIERLIEKDLGFPELDPHNKTIPY